MQGKLKGGITGRKGKGKDEKEEKKRAGWEITLLVISRSQRI